MNRKPRRSAAPKQLKPRAAASARSETPMLAGMPDRGLKIGEAAAVIGVETYVLRFWETQFPFLKPRHSRTKHRFYHDRDLDVLRLIQRLLQQEGFTINQQKFRVIRNSQRQVVTGIVVNEKLRVPRELRRELRAILHNCEKTSVEEQAKKHPRFKGNTGAFSQYLRGIAAYLNMVQSEHGAELLRRVNELLGGSVEGDEAADGKAGDA